MAIRKPAIGVSETVVLERLARLMRAAEHEGDLNPAQWEALRYVGRANRFSNSPGALTQYLAATKGTVSQTVIALEKKGLVAKGPRHEEPRSVTLTLTEPGAAMLARDPWQRLGAEIDKLGPRPASASPGLCATCCRANWRGATSRPSRCAAVAATSAKRPPGKSPAARIAACCSINRCRAPRPARSASNTWPSEPALPVVRPVPAPPAIPAGSGRRRR